MSIWLRRARARSGAAFVRGLAVLVVLCQATAWMHAAVTPHVTCLEHGESVHLATRQAPAPGGDLAVVGAPAEAAAHAHEHCNLQGQRTTSAPGPAHASVERIAAEAPKPPAPRPPAAGALLHLAPKTSPPRAPAV